MTIQPPTVNDNLALICGEAIAGKSASFEFLNNPEGVWYFNCEAGKKLPFPDKFTKFTITDPYQIMSGINAANKKPEIHTILIDSLTFLVQMFESVHVIPAADTYKAWANYGEYIRNLMQQYVASTPKNVIFTAHLEPIFNDKLGAYEYRVPVKGQAAKVGLEAYFSCIVTVKTMEITKLESFKNPMLNITEEEEMLGIKHVFQTRKTKDNLYTRGIRSPRNMWTPEETYIDNNCQFLLNKLVDFYNV